MEPEHETEVMVQTVTDKVCATELGMTLVHEHLFTDNRPRCREPDVDDAEAQEISDSPLRTEYLGRLRHDPMLSRDNAVLDDPDLAIEEVLRFRAVGGQTIISQTPLGMGRREEDLIYVAQETGLNVIAGAGYYMEAFHPEWIRSASIDEIAESLVKEVTTGTATVRAGLLGEIGISSEFNEAERRVLQASGRAQVATKVPLSIHLAGWERHGGEVLNLLAQEGCPPSSVLLSHMNPSVHDVEYQRTLARRGAWLSFDMLGIDWWFDHQNTQAPSDDLVSQGIAKLMREGFGERILLSTDTYLKMQLRKFGGYGYDHIPNRFLPALIRQGVDPGDAASLLVVNPRRLFELAARN